ncbi:MAG: HAMP domain-containing histidine kinase, partial [Chitinophagaceae bacterium]|nr:HAMP domain-containing histidine kinase [Anaerolineae bacterium]
MTQVDAQHQQDQHAILRDVLHIIATNPEPQSSIPPILEAARTLTSATGASLLVFSEPYLMVTMGEAESALPPAEEAKILALALPYGVHINPPLPEAIPALQGGWVAAQIRIQKQIVGLFWLVFDSKPEFSESAMQGVQSMVDGLTIVTMNTRAIARHEKLGRNQSEFMRIVSHDLRSPLTSIQGFASMLEQGTVGDINERQAHFVEKILSGVNQMTLLVDNFQDAGRYDPETGFYEMERSHCDLTEMVSRIIKNYLVPAEKQELSVSAVISDDVPII